MFNHANISLSQDEKDRLFLTWLAYTNFQKLKDNQQELKRTWLNLKEEVSPYFRNYKHSLEEISGTCGKMSLTANPEVAFCFDSDSNTITFNVLNLFFSSCPDREGHDFVSTLPWKLGGQLVHEFDHFLFFKENSLAKTKKEADEFCDKHLVEMETSAFTNQIEFLENAKTNASISTIMNVIKVDSWTVEGEPLLNKKSHSYMLSKSEVISQINQQISHFTRLLEHMNTDYTEIGNSNNKGLNLKMLKILGLKALNKNGNGYLKLDL